MVLLARSARSRLLPPEEPDPTISLRRPGGNALSRRSVLRRSDPGGGEDPSGLAMRALRTEGAPQYTHHLFSVIKPKIWEGSWSEATTGWVYQRWRIERGSFGEGAVCRRRAHGLIVVATHHH
jgi:hypothetical protein